VDIHGTDPFTKAPNKPHVYADTRQPLPFGREFDTAILGDILEHMTDEDAVASIRNAKAVLKKGGRLVITCPEDHRKPEKKDEYAPGVDARHPRPITRKIIDRWLGAAKVRIRNYQAIDYGDFFGHGVTAA